MCKIIRKSTNELLIVYLPYLGPCVDYGGGDICLEESNDSFKVYIIDRTRKFQYEEFFKIEDAIQKLISIYEEEKLVDNPDKMEEIFYQTLGLIKQENVATNKTQTKVLKFR